MPFLDPDTFPPPSGREEAWRFTPLARISWLDAAPEADGTITVTSDAAPEVTVSSVDRSDPRFGSVLTPADRYAALAMARFTHGTLVHVPANTVASGETTVHVSGGGGTAYGHLLVDVEHHAEAIVVLDHRGSGTFVAIAEYRVGDGANLTVVSLQDWDDGTIHLGAHAASVGRDAHFRSVIVTLGGDLVRIAPTVTYAGPGGDAELLGLVFADAGQHLEHRLLVTHNEPNCRSRVTYKCALQGEGARTVWVGDVFIGKDAIGTDTYESNRNLVLTDGARAHSIPNLEIETGEVSNAGHASATGRFDDLQLFYLMSRGIPADEAKRLVVRGFFADVIAAVGVPALWARLSDAVEAELAKALV